MPNLNDAPSLDITAFLTYLIAHLLIYNLFYYTQPFISSANYTLVLIYFNSSFVKF